MDKQYNELMIEQLRMYEKQTGELLEVKDGKPYYKGLLSCVSDGLPDNLVVDGSLMCYVDSTKLPKGLKVSALLDISETDITEIPDDCEFKSLNVNHTKVTKLRDNLELDSLKAYKSSLTVLPKGLKINGMLDISDTNITEIPDDCEFGSLDISETKITKLRDNLELKYLNVCGSLLQELPKGLKVEGLLNISHTNITKIPDDCEFDSLNISYTKITKLRDNLELDCLIIHNTPLKNLPKNLIIFSFLGMGRNYFTTIPNDCLVTCVCCSEGFNDERYRLNQFIYYYLKDDFVHINHPSGREFLHADGILSEVIEKKGNVYHVRNSVNGLNGYVVTDGNNHWAHGYTLDEAKQDLHYKMSFRDKSEYEKLTLDSELPYDEAIACYRVITGACQFGTKSYLEHRLPKPNKEKYTIREMIELTKGEYGGKEFREFFEK
jgi:hypothetical protein